MFLKYLLLSLFIFVTSTLYAAEPMVIHVVSVVDGDISFIEIGTGKKITVNLISTDAPELDQPYGLEAKTHLQKLVN